MATIQALWSTMLVGMREERGQGEKECSCGYSHHVASTSGFDSPSAKRKVQTKEYLLAPRKIKVLHQRQRRQEDENVENKVVRHIEQTEVAKVDAISALNHWIPKFLEGLALKHRNENDDDSTKHIDDAKNPDVNPKPCQWEDGVVESENASLDKGRSDSVENDVENV